MYRDKPISVRFIIGIPLMVMELKAALLQLSDLNEETETYKYERAYTSARVVLRGVNLHPLHPHPIASSPPPLSNKSEGQQSKGERMRRDA